MQVQAQTQAQLQQQAVLQGAMAMSSPYAMNLNQDARFGNMIEKPQTEKKKVKTLDIENEKDDLASVGGKMNKKA
jgi:hypothetical protein